MEMVEKQEMSGIVELTSGSAGLVSLYPTSEPQPYPPWASAQEYPPPTTQPPPPAYSLETPYSHAAPLPQQPSQQPQQQQQQQVVLSVKSINQSINYLFE